MPETSRRLEYNCQPRLNWPAGFSRTPKAERQRAAFGRSNPVAAPGSYRGKVSMTIAAAVSRLTEELDKFTKPGRNWRTTEVVITADVPVLARSDFRSQGPEPDDRGAALWFELDGREVVLCCDKWDRIADNITAIAKTLEAMRGLERWGVSETERAFTGFAALPAPGESTSRTWWDILWIDCFDNNTQFCIQERSKILGLYAPVKLDAKGANINFGDVTNIVGVEVSITTEKTAAELSDFEIIEAENLPSDETAEE